MIKKTVFNSNSFLIVEISGLRHCFIFFLVFLFVHSGPAQVDHPKFNHLTLKDGLQQSSVLSLFQDSKGIIWIGTEDGLHKYDGYHFQVFSHKPGEPNTLSNNRINSIVEDANRNLWIGTNYGLNKFDLETERFRQVLLADSLAISHDQHKIYQVLYDSSENLLWIGSHGGLDKFKLSSLSSDSLAFEHFPVRKDKPYLIGARGLMLDSDNNLWFGTGKGAVKLNRKTQKLEFPMAKREREVSDIEEDTRGYIWVCSKSEIEFFHKDSLVNGHSRKINLSAVGDFENHYYFPLFRGRSGNIWAATLYGLIQFEAGTGKIVKVVQEYDEQNSINNQLQYTSMMEDASGMFWIGAYGGISLVNLPEQRFSTYQAPSDPMGI